MKVDEQERIIKELESALEHGTLDLDRKVTEQQHDYEQKIQVLMKQLADSDLPGVNGDSNIPQEAK